MEYQFHPAANAFPMMNTGRTNELSEDIKKHGLLQPILLCEGKILDGRNRYKACLDLGIEPKFSEYNGNPWNMAWSMNGQRRDLVQEQRYLVWKFCNKHSEAWRDEKKRIQDEANRKRGEAAKAQHEVSKPYAGEKMVVAQSVQVPSNEPADKTRQAKASLAKVNRGSVERGDRLVAERPDLAEKQVVPQSVAVPANEPAHKARQAKAKASKTNRGSVCAQGRNP